MSNTRQLRSHAADDEMRKVPPISVRLKRVRDRRPTDESLSAVLYNSDEENETMVNEPMIKKRKYIKVSDRIDYCMIGFRK